jgi:hypothetical protein
MGYRIEQKHSEFRIRKEHFQSALEEINRFVEVRNAGDSLPWVNAHRVLTSNSLPEALSLLRWSPQIDQETGDICSIYFEGEKLGSDKAIFDAIAIFVEPGSFIAMRGEDSSIWEWKFNGFRCIEG